MVAGFTGEIASGIWWGRGVGNWRREGVMVERIDLSRAEYTQRAIPATRQFVPRPSFLCQSCRARRSADLKRTRRHSAVATGPASRSRRAFDVAAPLCRGVVRGGAAKYSSALRADRGRTRRHSAVATSPASRSRWAFAIFPLTSLSYNITIANSNACGILPHKRWQMPGWRLFGRSECQAGSKSHVDVESR